MKQEITEEQFLQLSSNAREKLAKWSEEKEYGSKVVLNDWDYRLLTIGQMIEFLQENTSFDMKTLDERYIESNLMRVSKFAVGRESGGVFIAYDGELCDSLWESIKKILNK